MKNLKKFLALLLALCMLTSMLGAAAFAAGEEEEDATETVVCTKAEDCAAETHEEGCPLYVAPENDPEPTEEQPGETEAEPTATPEPTEEPELCEHEWDEGKAVEGGTKYTCALCGESHVLEKDDSFETDTLEEIGDNNGEPEPQAEQTETENVTGYAGAALPAGPDMNGDTVTVTPENAQYTLDGAYGSINGKTIVFTGEYTDILYVNRPSKYPGSGTVYYNGYSGRTKVDSASDLKQTGVTSYTRDLNNVTLTAAAGVVIPGIQVYGCGHHHDSKNTGTAMDPVREILLQTTNTSFYFNYKLDGLTFDGLTIQNQVEFSMWDDSAQEDGAGKNITFRNCTFLGDEDQMSSLQAVKVVATRQNYNNLTVEDCIFTNYYQGVYTSNVSTGTFKDNSFTNLTHNAIALQNGAGMTVGGKIEISGNTFKDGKDRCIRFGNIGENAEIVVSNNTAINSGDDAGEIMKAGTYATDIAPTASITIAADNNWGEGKTVNDLMLPAAEVNGKGYATLQAAINDCPANGTVTMLKDVELTGQVSLNGKTLDLGGNTLSNGSSYFGLVTNGNATVKNGTIELSNAKSSKGYCGIYVSNGHTTAENLTIQSANYTTDEGAWNFGNAGVRVAGSSTFTLNANSTIKMHGYGIVAVDASPTIHVYGTVECSKLDANGYAPAAISGNGNNKTEPGSTINIYKGASVKSLQGVAIYHPQMGTLNINGGLVEGDSAGIAIKSGTLNVKSGATVSCVGKYAAPTEPWGNGAEASGAAIQIEANSGYAGGIEVNVEDGATVESTYGNAIYQYYGWKNDETVDQAKDKLTKITITGGAIIGGSGVKAVDVYDAENADGKIAISGGTFSTDVSAYCAEGLVATEGENGEYTIGAKAGMVAQVVGGGAYETLQAALTAANSGDVVTIIKAGEYAPITVPAGVTVQAAENVQVTFKNTASAHMVLEAEAVLKNVTVDNTGNTASNLIQATAVAYGKSGNGFTLDGCTIVGGGKGLMVLHCNDKEMTIKNCTIKNFERGYYACGDNNALGTLTVTGNTFENVKIPVDGYWGKKATDSTQVTITGNTFDNGGELAYVCLWDYTQYLNSSSDASQGSALANVTVKENTGDYQLQLIHTDWRWDTPDVAADASKVVYCSYVAVALDNAENIASVKAQWAGEGELPDFMDHTTATKKGGKLCFYELPVGKYNVTVTYNDNTTATQEFTVASSEVGKTQTLESPKEAKIGQVKYTTLQEAITAAQSGDTVTLLKDVTVDSTAGLNQATINIPAGVTLDGNGKTITAGSFADQAHMLGVVGVGNDPVAVTIKDLTVDMGHAANSKHALNVHGWTDVTLENVTLKNANTAGMVVNGGGVTAAGLVTSGNTWGAVNVDKGGLLKVDSIENLAEDNKIWSEDAQQQYGSRIEITASGYVTVYDTDKVYFTNAAAAEKLAVAQADKDGNGEVEENVYYATLQGAVDACADGGRVKLINNASGSGVIINKSITVDFNGKCYTVSKDPVGSAGTATQGFQILAGADKANPNTVTMVNGQIVLPSTTENLYMGIQNYADLTLDGITIDASGNSNISYVLSNNNGVTTITGGTVLRAAEGKVAFDVYDYSAGGYGNVTVRVVDAASPCPQVEIVGKIEVSDSDKATLAISGGKYTTELKADWCAEGFLPVRNTDGTYGVATELTLEPTTLRMTVGYTTSAPVTLTVTTDTTAEVTWTSSDETVVTVDERGVVTPVGAGTATVTASVNGVESGVCAVTVIRTSAPYIPPVTDPDDGDEDLEDPDVPLAGALPFEDVSRNDWFFGAISSVYLKELMTGISGTEFGPEMLSNRGTVATILHRMENTPDAGMGDFTDVLAGQWYTPAINWANQAGVMIGYGNGVFLPEAGITREQLALTFYRYRKIKGQPVDAKGDLSTFADGEQVSDWAREAMEWAVGSGLLKGTTENCLAPQGLTKRSELAAVLERFLELK